MRTLTIGSCALLLGCGPTVFLDRARDASPADASSADASSADASSADASSTDAPSTDAGTALLLQATSSRDVRFDHNGYSRRVGDTSVWIEEQSVFTTGDLDAGDGIDGFTTSVGDGQTVRSLFPASPGCLYLPGPWVAASDGAAVFFTKGCGGDQGAGLARWTPPGREVERASGGPVPGHPELLFGGVEGFHVNAALRATIAGVDTIYAFDCSEGFGYAFPCRLARVPRADSARPAAWSFWSGTTWTSTYARAANAAVFVAGTNDIDVAWNDYLRRYLAIDGPHFPLGSPVVRFRTATSPEGPWSEPQTLFVPLEAPAGTDLTFGYGWAARLHAEYDANGGRRIHLTYNRPAPVPERHLVAVDLSACHVEATAAPICPTAAVSQVADTRPSFRVTHLQVATPAALASPAISGTFNPTVRAGGLLWGVTFDLVGGRVRTGAMELVERGATGQGLLDGRFRFFASGDRASAEGALTVAGDRATSAALPGPVRLPFYGTDGALLTTLPLRCVRFVDVSLASRRCLGDALPAGGRFNECTSAWRASARVEAVITVADAPPTWSAASDTTCEGQPGFAFAANLAAISARIE